MGVIKDLSSYFDVYTPSIVESFEEAAEVESLPEESSRQRPRRSPKPRPAPVWPEHTAKTVPSKIKGAKKLRRYENTNFLVSMAESEDLNEISIHDFLQGSLSAFAQILLERDNMKVWNQFINCNEDEWNDETNTGNQSRPNDEDPMETNEGLDSDFRTAHPAFSAEECFRKIDGDLRSMLKKRHVPLGTLTHLESELSLSFQTSPGAVRLMQLANSFERLMVHALAQYMDLCSNSYNKAGIRWTRVHNRNNLFRPPAIMLATYLEQRYLLRKTL